MPRLSPESSAHPGILPTGAAAARGAKKRAPPAPAGPQAAPAQSPQRPTHGPRGPGQPGLAPQKTQHRAEPEKARPRWSPDEWALRVFEKQRVVATVGPP